MLARLSGRPEPVTTKDRETFFGAGALDVSSRVRAFLKVQDGCNMVCAYCVIPSVRGGGRSRTVAGIVEDAQSLVAAGYNEIVITGVHLGSYGRDLRPKESLESLVRAILADTDLPRLRISSIEPMELREDLAVALAESDRVCHHFHVPLQSGEERVLRSMRRPYNPEQYFERAGRLVELMPDTLIGSDIIAGFPGEDEASFAETMRFVERSPIHHLHVFPYSARPGTHAATLGGQVPGDVARRRSAELRRLGAAKFTEFKKRFVGDTRQALALTQNADGTFDGLTRNYLPVRMRGDYESGKEYPVRLNELWGSGLKSVLAADRA
ncbi:MAG: MiaB/RimO family radical SAM methylthiotransferase [Deltaproteobacteria bacterium]|nr:MiaB/RimO family radical SAM methylthiotransferase [Deltaproteobacteria bacterium]